MVRIGPRFQEILEGEYKGELWDNAHSIQFLIDNNGYQPIGKLLGVACIKRTDQFVEVQFYRGMYFCDVRINDFGGDKADMPKYEKLVRYFSNIIFKKMPAIVIENPK